MQKDSKTKPPQDPSSNTRTGMRAIVKPQPWHAVSIDAKPLSCAAAQAIHKKRFLSKEAPVLPLESCKKGSRCPCTYKHHEDRRGGLRRNEARLSSKPVNERRLSRGRRQGD